MSDAPTKRTVEAVAMMLALSRTERNLALESLRETLCLKCGDATPERDCYCDYESNEYDVPDEADS